MQRRNNPSFQFHTLNSKTKFLLSWVYSFLIVHGLIFQTIFNSSKIEPKSPGHFTQIFLCNTFYFGAAIQYQRIQCQRIQSQRFANFYCYLLTIYCKYEQFLYILLSKKTNISKMTSDLLVSNQQFEINQTRGVGTKCVGTKQLRLIMTNNYWKVKL